MRGAFQVSLQVHNLSHKRGGNSWASILHPVSRWIHAGFSTHHKFPEPRLRLIRVPMPNEQLLRDVAQCYKIVA